MSWKDKILDEFKAHLTLTASELTKQAYMYDIAHFFAHEATEGLRRASMIKAPIANRFLSALKERGKSSATLNRYYVSLRKLGEFMRRVHFVNFDFMKDVVAPKVENKAPRVLTVAEVEKLMRSPNLGSDIGWRDRAILELLYSSGLRSGEVTGLKIKDVQETEVFLSRTKGGKTRTVPLTKTAYDFMSRLLTDNRPIEAFVFGNVYGRQLTRQTINEIVRFHAKNCGLKDVTTHTLRHTCATHLLNEGADITFIRDLLGHVDIKTTQRYVNVTSVQMKTMFQKFHPRENRIV